MSTTTRAARLVRRQRRALHRRNAALLAALIGALAALGAGRVEIVGVALTRSLFLRSATLLVIGTGALYLAVELLLRRQARRRPSWGWR